MRRPLVVGRLVEGLVASGPVDRSPCARSGDERDAHGVLRTPRVGGSHRPAAERVVEAAQVALAMRSGGVAPGTAARRCGNGPGRESVGHRGRMTPVRLDLPAARGSPHRNGARARRAGRGRSGSIAVPMEGESVRRRNCKARSSARAAGLWRVRDSNPRRLRRLIYSQIPLAAWVTRPAARADRVRAGPRRGPRVPGAAPAAKPRAGHDDPCSCRRQAGSPRR